MASTHTTPIPLILHNSQTRTKAQVAPIHAGELRLYVCGMTVYDYCHIGHARVMVCFDVFVRFLRAAGWKVRYVRNITDIDDKIIQRAQENGETIQALTERFIDAMHEDADALGCLRPDESPKATEYIDQMQAMIRTLVDKQLAYAVPNGDVYYAVNQFAPYGQLSNRKLEDMQAGARVEVDDVKRNPLDFVLWKAAKPAEPAWNSPWGMGRPGWHIECSAMSTCCLGNHFDIHGGGGDLLFPHHENEIAQSEGATGEKYVNTWMHVGFVNVDGEKMSKSLGNFFTIRDVLHAFNPEVVRYFIVASHYRSPLNFSDQALKDAHASLLKFYTGLKLAEERLSHPVSEPLVSSTEKVPVHVQHFIDRTQTAFEQALADDVNTPEALAILFEVLREMNRLSRPEQDGKGLQAVMVHLTCLAGVLGLLTQPPHVFIREGARGVGAETGLADSAIDALVAERQHAKAEKNFARADEIRNALKEQGIVIEDAKTGVSWRRM